MSAITGTYTAIDYQRHENQERLSLYGRQILRRVLGPAGAKMEGAFVDGLNRDEVLILATTPEEILGYVADAVADMQRIAKAEADNAKRLR